MDIDDKKEITSEEVSSNSSLFRRNVLKWMGVGAVGGLWAVWAYSRTSPLRKYFLPQAKVGEKRYGA